MKTSFKDLGISLPILKAIDEMGFKVPTEVQSKAIPHILDKKDLIVMSKTGSGKTAVFGVSLLQQINPGSTMPQGLILSPTRELAVQVDNDLKKMARYLGHRTAAVYGKHSMSTELQTLKKGVSIITGTPGRIIDHIEHGNLVTGDIRFLVLDEADRMLDMGFIGQVMKIIKALPRNRVTLLFSATIPPEVRRICREYMNNPVTIEIESPTKTVDTINQCYYRVDIKEKRTQLHRLLLVEQPESCMIFCNTRIAVDRVQSFLSRKGLACEALHGDIPQGKRLKTMQQFKQGGFHLLAATDVAARGIHIDDLSLVINYDVPVEKDSYVHRIGRTGRAGKGGRAISLVTSDDIMSLYEIEEHIGALIKEAELPSEAIVNEKASEAAKWLEENSIEARQAKNAFAYNSKEAGKKASHTKASRDYGNNRIQKDKTEKTPGRNEQADNNRLHNSGRDDSLQSGVGKYSPSSLGKSGPARAAKPGFDKAGQAYANRQAQPGFNRSGQANPARSGYGAFKQERAEPSAQLNNKQSQSRSGRSNQTDTGRNVPSRPAGSRNTPAASGTHSSSAASTANSRQRTQQSGLTGQKQKPEVPLLKRILQRILGR